WVQWANDVCEAYTSAAGVASGPHAAAFPLLPSILLSLFSLLQYCAEQLPSHLFLPLRASMLRLCSWPLRIDDERRKQVAANAAAVSPLPVTCAAAALRLLCALPVQDVAAEVALVGAALESERAAVQCAAVLLLPTFVARMSTSDKRVQGNQL